MTSLLDICLLTELPPGASRRVETDEVDVAIINCDGTVFAMEDRCSHDDSVLLDGGVIDQAACTIECPRHGSVFDLRTGHPITLPAYEDVETFPIVIEDGIIKLELE